MRDQRDASDLRESGTAAAIIRKLSRPLPPKQFFVERQKDGLRFRCIGRDRVVEQDGSIKYRVRWAENVNTSTKQGELEGYARSIIVKTLDAPGEEIAVTELLQDGAYASGFFYCEGVDIEDNVSDYVLSSRQTSEILDTSIAGDVTHLQMSESGERHGDTTMSLLTVSCRAPNPKGSFGRAQLWYKDYPVFGALNEGESSEYNGPAAGYMQFPGRNAIGRNAGTGTVATTNGSATITGTSTKFLQQVNAQGLFEALGVQGTIQSIDSDTQITLTAVWTGKTTTGLADFFLYPLITVYVVSVSKGGTRRTDIENAPSKQLVFDGQMSAPNAPAAVSTVLGNLIRIDITPLIGTSIDHYNIYRATGSGQSLATAQGNGVFGTVKHDPRNVAGTIPFEDVKFTTYEREQGQTFTYWVTAVTTGTQALESSGTRAFLIDGVTDPSCRLDSPADGGGTEPTRFVAKNMLWNALLSGDAGDINAASNASVDANMGVALPAGFYRPAGVITGVGSAPAYQNGREILLAMTGAAANGVSLVRWTLDASDHATAANRRVPNGKMVSIQWQARHSAGTINGFLKADIVQVNTTASATITNATNATPIVITTSAAHGFATGQKRVWIAGVTGNTAANGVWTITVLTGTTFSLDGSVGNGAYVAGGGISGLAGLRNRASNDVVDFDAYQLVVNGSDITDVHSLYWGAFYLDPAFVTTSIQARIWYEVTDWSGVNIAIMEPMLALGDGLPYWSAEIDPNTTYPPVGGGVAPPRGRFTDRDGRRREFIRLP